DDADNEDETERSFRDVPLALSHWSSELYSACTLDANFASSEYAPAPTNRRKIDPSSMAKSMRASCAMLQKPYKGNLLRLNRQKPWPKRIGSFVETSATQISMISGIAANRVNRPKMISKPQTISTVP